MSDQVGSAVYSHVMSNGAQLDIREVPGFGTRSEIGFFIKDTCIGTYVIDKKRSGNVEVKPTMMRQQKVGEKVDDAVEVDETPEPSLSDISTEN